MKLLSISFTAWTSLLLIAGCSAGSDGAELSTVSGEDNELRVSGVGNVKAVVWRQSLLGGPPETYSVSSAAKVKRVLIDGVGVDDRKPGQLGECEPVITGSLLDRSGASLGEFEVCASEDGIISGALRVGGFTEALDRIDPAVLQDASLDEHLLIAKTGPISSITIDQPLTGTTKVRSDDLESAIRAINPLQPSTELVNKPKCLPDMILNIAGSDSVDVSVICAPRATGKDAAYFDERAIVVDGVTLLRLASPLE